MPETKKRSWTARIATLLITSLMCVAVIEVFLRLFLPVYQTSILEAYEYDPELGTRLKAGVHLFETTDFQDEIKTNKLGTTNFQESWDAYENLIIAVGDSYTQGTGLPMDLSYPGQLDSALNRDQDLNFAPRFGVVNIGVPGYGGEQSLIALNRWWNAQARKPKFILYMGCDNDYEDDVLFKSGYRHSHLVDGNPKWGIFVRPLQWATSDLQVAIRLKVAIGRIRRSSVGVADGSTADPNNPGPSVSELERSVLERLAAFAKEKNATLVLSWSDEGRAYEWSKQWAVDNNIPFADWSQNVKAARSLAPALPFDNQHSGGHHRGWVNRMIADAFAAQINKASN